MSIEQTKEAEMNLTDKVKAGARRLTQSSPALRQLLIRTWKSYRKGGLRQVMHFAFHGHVLRAQSVSAFSRQPGPKYVQVGGGQHSMSGKCWINCDLIGGDIYVNAAKKLPFADNSIDAIFTEQFFEHLSLEEGIHFLNEALRVLRPGGVLRQSTPDLKGLVEVYLGENRTVTTDQVVSRHMRLHRPDDSVGLSTPGRFFNDMFRMWGHRFVYDRDTLYVVTKNAGFVDLTWPKFGVSAIPELANRERHADEVWMQSAFTLICEARKPNILQTQPSK